MNQEPTYLILLGAPGAGKGTQAALLMQDLGIPHVSSGDLFRENLGNQTALGKLAQSYMEQGELVPDDVTIAMVMDRLGQPDCAKGAILDGFPRTLAQAGALEEAFAEQGRRVFLVPYVRVSERTLLARLAGRWTCKGCKALYHQIFNPPQVAGKCDECGGVLFQRADDTPETQKTRIDVYMEQTQPLIDYYGTAGLLREIDGEGDVEHVHAALLEAIRQAGRNGCSAQE
jgi:adenylate kinase